MDTFTKAPLEESIVDLEIRMAATALQYMNRQADMVYVYCAGDGNMATIDFFFRFADKLVRKHKVNEYLPVPVDVSSNAQSKTLAVICNLFHELLSLHKKEVEKVPLELRITYEVSTQKYNADYRYDPKMPNSVILAGSELGRWFNLIRYWTPPLIGIDESASSPFVSRESNFGHSFQIEDGAIAVPPEHVGNLGTVMWNVGFELGHRIRGDQKFRNIWFIQVNGVWRRFCQDRAHQNIESLLNGRLKTVRVELLPQSKR